MDVLRIYYGLFGEFPPVPKTMSYEDEIVQKLMRHAIVNNVKITPEFLEKFLEKNKIVYDIDFN